MITFAFRRSRVLALALAAALSAAAAHPGRAAEASPWDKGDHSAARLIAGSAAAGTPQTVLRAGIEIALQPEWKTYWRYPGDSGVPPRFTFDRSENVKDVNVLWPAPLRFADGGGLSIGYGGRVVFPLRIVPVDAGKPAVLRLDLDYAVCEKLCVPVQAKLDLALGSAPTPHDAALTASEARVPRRAGLGAGGPLAIAAVRRAPGPKHPRVIVDVAAPAGSAVDLFAEGPDPAWALPLPQPLEEADGVRRFAFDLDGIPPGASASPLRLRLTAVAGNDAVEVAIDLD